MKKKHTHFSKVQFYWLFKQLIPYIKPYLKTLFTTLLALCGAVFAILAIGPSLHYLIDSGFQTGNPIFLYKAVLILVVISITIAFASYIRLSTTSVIAEQIISDIRKELFTHLMKLDAYYFDKARLGDLIARFTNDCIVLKTLLSSAGAVALRSTLQLIGATILMLTTSIKLTALIFLVIPIALVPLWLLGRTLKKKTHDSHRIQGKLIAFIEERLKGVLTIQAYTQEEYTVHKLEKIKGLSLRKYKQSHRIRALLISMIIGSVFITISFVLGVGGKAVLLKVLTPGTFISFLFYALVAAGSLNEMAEVIGDFQAATAAMERLVGILHTPPSLSLREPLVALNTPVHGHLAMSKVYFSYPERLELLVLNDISFKIEKGEKVALVGPSGAGKTTLFKLLLRFYDPLKGQILIDNQELSKFSLKGIRQAFSFVSQETTIFHDSVYNNISFANPKASYQEVLSAAKAAYVNEFVENFPQGFHTIVGDQGRNLSGGQCQRIAIARALLKNSPILLLDEATNALDPGSEALIRKAIKYIMKDRTTLIIAHHLSTILSCDRIIVMDKGKIVETGSHAELISSNGLYQKLYQKEFFIQES